MSDIVSRLSAEARKLDGRNFARKVVPLLREAAEFISTSSRDRVHRAFQVKRGIESDGSVSCRCPYCTGDADLLADMVANYELETDGYKQRADAAEAENARLRESLTALVALWRQQQREYPPEGDLAAAAVRCCARELEELLQPMGPTS